MDETKYNRAIDYFPLAYDSSASPYRQYRFDGSVREFCDRDVMTARPQLRVAKCIFVGDIAVGKTCLINRFGYKIFTNNYKATIGVDFDVQKFRILNIPFNLQIWDTAGQERFRSITKTYYRGAHVAVIAFDMANVASLSSAKKWLDEVMESVQPQGYKPLVFLVGCKKELLCEAAFQFVEREGKKMANELGAEFWAVSSSTGDGVEDFFTRVATLTFHEMIKREVNLANLTTLPRAISYNNRNNNQHKFIKLKRNKDCKKFWNFKCARF